MFTENCKRNVLTILSLLVTILQQLTSSKGLECTGNQPLISGLHFSVLDYQMWANSNDSNSYQGSDFGEDSTDETLISYEGRIGADYYRGWCSEANPVVTPYLQVDFKRDVVIKQVETQGLLVIGEARYITGFWLAYSASPTMPFINVTEGPTNNSTKIFSGQDVNDYKASVVQDLPQPINARVIQLYPTNSIPATRVCLKLELHGCVPQRREDCQSVYALSGCSYDQPVDMISAVEVTSDDPTDSLPGPVANILSYNDVSKYWCGHRNAPLPVNATFHFTEEVLLTSVAFHGLDGPRGDDYVTEYSWEYSVGNSSFQTYTDLGNVTVFDNTREDRFQQTFWTPIHVQTLKFVIFDKAIRPCIAFKFFGCKLREVISIPQVSSSTPSPILSSTISSSISTTINVTTVVSVATTNSVLDSAQCSLMSSCGTATVTVAESTITVMSTIVPTPTTMTASTSSNVLSSSTPIPQANCYGDKEPLISGARYYVNDDQLSASGHDPLHYNYDTMNERIVLTPQESRIGSMYNSFVGWCSQIVTNLVNNAPYIQVEFGTYVKVSAVAVQGFEINGDVRQPRYVTEFQLAYKSLETDEFCAINDEDGQPMNFTGNNNTSILNVARSTLSNHIRATAFRLYPLDWISKAVMNGNDIVDTGRACLKWELYGCAELTTEECFANQSLLNSDDVMSITSNSPTPVVTTSLFRFADSNDKWCPSTQGANLPLIITFAFVNEVSLTSIAIAGQVTKNVDLFVTSYSLSYVNNGSCNLTLYKDLQGESVFYINHVQTYFHSFWEPIRVQQLQLILLDWHVNPCVSVGFFGCKRSNAVFDNFTTLGNSLADGTCAAPMNNLLLSCVNKQMETSSSSDNAATIAVIVLSVALAAVLIVFVTALLFKRFKARVIVRQGSPISLHSINALYEIHNKKSHVMDGVGKYNKKVSIDEETNKFLDDRDDNYNRLQHHQNSAKRPSTSPYSNLLPGHLPQSYAVEGPQESDSTYEQIPYVEITSKSD